MMDFGAEIGDLGAMTGYNLVLTYCYGIVRFGLMRAKEFQNKGRIGWSPKDRY